MWKMSISDFMKCKGGLANFFWRTGTVLCFSRADKEEKRDVTDWKLSISFVQEEMKEFWIVSSLQQSSWVFAIAAVADWLEVRHDV